jgi:hypothetical protein
MLANVDRCKGQTQNEKVTTQGKEVTYHAQQELQYIHSREQQINRGNYVPKKEFQEITEKEANCNSHGLNRNKITSFGRV